VAWERIAILHGYPFQLVYVSYGTTASQAFQVNRILDHGLLDRDDFTIIVEGRLPPGLCDRITSTYTTSSSVWCITAAQVYGIVGKNAPPVNVEVITSQIDEFTKSILPYIVQHPEMKITQMEPGTTSPGRAP
jgi:hypothetical protein